MYLYRMSQGVSSRPRYLLATCENFMFRTKRALLKRRKLRKFQQSQLRTNKTKNRQDQCRWLKSGKNFKYQRHQPPFSHSTTTRSSSSNSTSTSNSDTRSSLCIIACSMIHLHSRTLTIITAMLLSISKKVIPRSMTTGNVSNTSLNHSGAPCIKPGADTLSKCSSS